MLAKNHTHLHTHTHTHLEIFANDREINVYKYMHTCICTHVYAGLQITISVIWLLQYYITPAKGG